MLIHVPELMHAAVAWKAAACTIKHLPTSRCGMPLPILRPQAEASTTDLASSDSFPSPLMARKPRANGEEVWKPLKNTYGAAWELSQVPTPPLHMKWVAGPAPQACMAPMLGSRTSSHWCSAATRCDDAFGMHS